MIEAPDSRAVVTRGGPVSPFRPAWRSLSAQPALDSHHGCQFNPNLARRSNNNQCAYRRQLLELLEARLLVEYDIGNVHVWN